MIPQSQRPDQHATAFLSRGTFRKFTTESSTSRFVLVTLLVAVAAVVVFSVGGALTSITVIAPIESLLTGRASPGFARFLLLFVGVFGSLAALLGGVVGLKVTLCLLWQRVESHIDQGANREGDHDPRDFNAGDG